MQSLAKKTVPWFTNFGQGADASVRMLCFPSSGGGSGMFRSWCDNLKDIEVCSIQLPGRERRFIEPPIDNLAKLVQQILPSVESMTDKPLIFFGHSMGALIAYELACSLRTRGSVMPRELVVSGFRSPEVPRRNKTLHCLEDSEFVRELTSYGGTPTEILQHEETMELILPMLRADFKLHETYSYEQRPPLSCPVTACAGENDHVVSIEEMQGWRAHTISNFKMHLFKGSHFFVNEAQSALMEKLQCCGDAYIQ